jgi:hypothetical protein
MTVTALDENGFYCPGAWTDEQLHGFAAEIGGAERPIDLGIVRAVKVLLDDGIETYESCEGGEGHAMPRPTVRFHGEASAGWRALSTCLTYDLPVADLARRWDVTPTGEPTGPYWEIVFQKTLS